MSDSRLILENISFSFRRNLVINSLSLELLSGVHFLTGPNGCGKSTLLRLIAGISQPDQGRILFRDESLALARPRRCFWRVSGFVPQETGLAKGFSAEAYLAYAIWLRGLDGPEAVAAEEEGLLLADLSGRPTDPVRRLSGGTQRRLEIASQIVGHPEVVLLDEPTSGVDAEHRQAIHQALIDLASTGSIIVLATHSKDEVVDMGGGIVHVINDGQVTSHVRHGGAELHQRLEGLW